MAKHYLEIGEHGLNGDFYLCNEQPGVFRADNLAIATKIAFNNYLKNFDNLGHDCRLKSITDGEFTVSTDTGDETYTVKYYGPAGMFTIEYEHKNGSDAYQKMYQKMVEMCESGDNRVRKSNRSGMVMFSSGFPRYRKNGEWWDWEHTYLSTDPELAAEQFEYAMASDDDKTIIRRKNYLAMCKCNGMESQYKKMAAEWSMK